MTDRVDDHEPECDCCGYRPILRKLRKPRFTTYGGG